MRHIRGLGLEYKGREERDEEWSVLSGSHVGATLTQAPRRRKVQIRRRTYTESNRKDLIPCEFTNGQRASSLHQIGKSTFQVKTRSITRWWWCRGLAILMGDIPTGIVSPSLHSSASVGVKEVHYIASDESDHR